MEILGYISAVIIGISLGLIGGGGSILTIPVLVYIFNIDPTSATAYSLFIVGITSLAGALAYIKRGEVDYLTGVIFAIPAFIAVYLTRRIVLPSIPDVIFQFDSIVISRDLVIMMVFALLMLGASISMIRKKKGNSIEKSREMNYIFIAGEGIVVGFFTGLVGAGGGFLIIPALVLLANLPMKTAIGTSLLIIAAKSLIGFTGDLGAHMAIDWTFLILIGSIATVGIFIGTKMSKVISGARLKPAFGWFVLLMGLVIIGKEISKFI